MSLVIPLWSLALAAQAAAPVPPQAWTLTHPGSEIVAETTLETGHSLTARCVTVTRTDPDGTGRRFRQVYLTVRGLTGLGNRLYAIRPDDPSDRLYLGEWLGSSATGEFTSTSPARALRLFRASGRVDAEFRAVSVAPDEPKGRSIAAALPTDQSALDQVLEGCGEPLQSDRDFPPQGISRAAFELIGQGPQWDRYPVPEYPERALMNEVPGGLVAMNCIQRADGGFTDCLVTYETPLGQGFGSAGLAAARRGRMFEPLEGAHAVWLYRFALSPP